jgi:hypothetical protein
VYLEHLNVNSPTLIMWVVERRLKANEFRT